MHDNRMPSPKSAYPQHQAPQYPPHPEQAGPNGPDGNHHPPQPGMPSDAAHHREQHDPRPSSVGPKRRREWEDDHDSKKPSTDEARARLDDMRHRRPSTPPRLEPPYRRNSSEAHRFDDRRMDDQRRMEEQRRVEDMRRAEEQQRHNNEGYHPSEAAHHPQSHSVPAHLPPMQQGPSPMQNIMHDGPKPGPGPGPGSGPGPVPKEYQSAPEERRLDHPPAPHTAATNEPERAGRPMDVDDNYDDAMDEDQKPPIGSGSTSGPSSATAEMKNGTPTSASINGIMGPKTESN